MRRLLAMVILGLAVAGCAGSTSAHSRAKAPSAKPAVLQLRVVLRAADASSKIPGSAAPAAWLIRFAHFTCPQGTLPLGNPRRFLIACDAAKNRYLLAPAAWQGTVQDPTAGRVEGLWAVDFTLGAGGARALATESRELYMSGGRLALVLEGRVLTAPGFGGVITDGSVQITGDLNETTADALVHRLAGR